MNYWNKLERKKNPPKSDELRKLCKKKRNIESRLHQILRPVIFERDGYKCRACGSTDNIELVRLHAGIGRAVSYEELWSEENLFTLCKRCHKFFDSLRGCILRNIFRVWTVETAILLIRNKEEFDANYRKWFQHLNTREMTLRDSLTLFKVLRKASIFGKQGDYKKSRFYLGLAKREWDFLSKKVFSWHLYVKINGLLNRVNYTDSENFEKSVKRLETEVRKAIMEYINESFPYYTVNEFKKKVIEQDNLLEKKALSGKLR